MLFAHLGALQVNIKWKWLFLWWSYICIILRFIFSSCSSGLRLTSNTYQTLIPLRKGFNIYWTSPPKNFKTPLSALRSLVNAGLYAQRLAHEQSLLKPNREIKEIEPSFVPKIYFKIDIKWWLRWFLEMDHPADWSSAGPSTGLTSSWIRDQNNVLESWRSLGFPQLPGFSSPTGSRCFNKGFHLIYNSNKAICIF